MKNIQYYVNQTLTKFIIATCGWIDRVTVERFVKMDSENCLMAGLLRGGNTFLYIILIIIHIIS